MSTCILVLGVPRSGTSCVGGVLHRLGVPMGERLREASIWNQGGFYQDLDVEDIVAYRDPAFTPDLYYYSEHHTPEIVEANLRQLIDSRNKRYPIWGINSHRMVHYVPLLQEMTDLKVICTKRSVAASVESWVARHPPHEKARGRGEQIVAYMADLIKTNLAECKVEPITVDFATLIAEPAKTVEEIANAIGMPVTQEAIKWVNAEYVRFDG